MVKGRYAELARLIARPDGLNRKTRRTAASMLRRFTGQEDGSLVLFGLFAFLAIFMIGGVGTDIMRHERLRIELQNTIDRAILAAADMDQTQDPETVVRDYFSKAGLIDYLTEVDVQSSGIARTVTARVSAEIETIFMQFAGYDTLPVSAVGTAQEAISNLEISMVLDVSNSMNQYSRINNLKTASDDFTTTIFATSEPGNVSISVVPYSTHVNAGADILSQFTYDEDHDYSHCVQFGSSDFATSNISPVTSLDQVAHFDPFYSYQNGQRVVLPACNPSPNREILPLSGNEASLDSKINGLIANGNTSIDLGVKWGSALLDPGLQPAVSGLIAAGVVDGGFAGRPASYSDGDTMKVMVVMTDGVNTNEYFMPAAYETGLSDIYWVPSEKRISVPIGNGNWYVPSSNTTSSQPYGGSNAQQMTWPEVWNTMSTSYHAYVRYLAAGYNANIYYDWMGKTVDYVDPATKNANLQAACTAAKDNGVIVFTIGFEVTDDSAQIMSDCASSEAHFHRVEGLEIAEAFSAIATKISQLRLVQ